MWRFHKDVPRPPSCRPRLSLYHRLLVVIGARGTGWSRAGGVPIARALATLAAAGYLLGFTGTASADVPLAVNEYPTPTASASPDGIVLGPDGALWFTESGANQIGRITNSGSITEFPLTATPSSGPRLIISGPDGAMWFTQSGEPSEVGRITTNGAASEVSIAGGGCSAGAGSGPAGIASGPDGNVWVTENRDVPGEIAKINVGAGDSLTEYCLTSGEPAQITPAADAALWFTVGMDEYASITTYNGSISPEILQTGSSSLIPIITGPDGALWLGLKGTQSVLDHITTTDVLSPFDLPASSPANPQVLGSGPDGQVWLAGGGDLTSVTTAGVFNQYDGVYPAADTIAGIVAGPADTLWLTDASASAIYRVQLSASPSIAAQLAPVSAVTSSSAVVAATLTVPSGDLAQPASYQFEYGPTTSYGSMTPTSATNATGSGTPVTASLSGLAPDTTYHYRLLASGCAPASCQAQTGDQSFTTGLDLTPVLGRSVAVASVRGRVRFRLPGTRRFRRLSRPGQLIPVGSTVDARHGRVLIESAVASASQQVASGEFYGGVFVVEQPSAATTTVLRLESSFAACPARARRATAAVATRSKASHKVVNRVFGEAHGDYTTRGHYAAAADQGTGWELADRCDGTFVAVSSGQVEVSDFVRHRSFALQAGRHYLASAR